MLDIFKKYKKNDDKLLAYGFVKNDQDYHYSKEIMEGDFRLDVILQAETIDYHVFDTDTEEEYLQVRMDSATGKFIGQVREVCQQVLLDIRQNCFDEIGFHYEQSQRLRDHAVQTYQAQIEYLWEKSSRKSSTHAGVFRHHKTKKWYGAFLTTDWSKFESNRSGLIEVLNVKSDQVSDLVKKEGIYPAFHMNKKYWLSLPLDDTLSDREIYDLLEISHQLTKKK